MADSRLRRLLAFDRQVRRDQAQSPVFVHRRDRRFALDCQARNETPSAGRWLEHLERVGQMRASGEAWSTPDAPDETLSRWQRLSSVFAFSGLILGVVTMTGLLYYEGGQRINLTALLAFAALQCLLAVITIVQSLVNWQPWHRVLRRLGLGDRESPLKSLMPAMMARVAHTGGLCFGLAGVATLLVLVVIQDLAFGWSTTLSTGAEEYHRLLTIVAWPWQHLWPAAIPDLALVESTRFFRAEAGFEVTEPGRWGQWWPFVLMVWLCYVVLPRLAGLILAQIQLHIRARRALADHAGMVALAYRLETPTVDTGNDNHDAADSPDENTAAQCQPLPDSQVLIYWAGADDPELPDSLSAGHLLIERAGGQCSLDDDQQTIERCAELLKKQSEPSVTLVARAWEPPIAELSDFIEQARHHWPGNTRIALLPLANDHAHAQPGNPQITNPRQLSQWLRFAERAGDERIFVSQPDLRSPQSRACDQQPEDLR
jgi:hypothetical protein